MEIENMIPKLIDGQLIENGHRLIYESKDDSSQIVLPLKYKAILLMLDGKTNVQSIAKNLYDQENAFSFKDLFECLDLLVRHKLVENLDQLNVRSSESNNVYDKKIPFISKILFEITLLKRLVLSTSFPIIFLLLSSFLIYIGQRSYFEFHNLNFLNKFLKINDSYAVGLIFFLLANSLLITFKNIFKFVLLLLATGRVYKIKIQLNLFSLSLRVDDSSIYTSKYKWHGVFYCAACVSSYYVLIYISSFLLPQFGLSHMLMDQLFVMATFLTIVDLDPFRKSDTSRLFNIFYEEENMAHLLPYLKKKALLAVTNKSEDWKRETLFILYSTLALFWLFNAFSLSLELLDNVFPNLASEFIAGEVVNKFASGIIFVSLLLLTLYFVSDLIKIFFTNLIYPCRNILRKLFFKKIQCSKSNNVETLGILKEVDLFQNLSNDYLEQLIAHGNHYNYSDGHNIISQGEVGESVYILLSGKVNIIIHRNSGAEEHVAVLNKKSVFGELALLNNEKRSADVVAIGKCLLFEMNRHDFHKLQSHEGHCEILNKIKLNQYISSSDLFDKLPSEAINIFTSAGSIKSFEAGEDIFQQGDEEDGFYLLYEGAVTVRINNQNMATIEQGGFFGEMALLQKEKRNATITTNRKVSVLNISSDLFWKLLFTNMNLAIFLETVANLRFLEGSKLSKVSI
jgi:CRP-like cAMP-binding protein